MSLHADNSFAAEKTVFGHKHTHTHTEIDRHTHTNTHTYTRTHAPGQACTLKIQTSCMSLRAGISFAAEMAAFWTHKHTLIHKNTQTHIHTHTHTHTYLSLLANCEF